MKRLAMTVLAVIVLATSLYYWIPAVQAREIACDLPGFEIGQTCP